MNYTCYTEYAEPEQLNISGLFYEIKNYRLIEITLDSWNWYYIRQRKDIPITYVHPETKEVFDMKYGTVYCTSWNDIESVRGWRWEKELEEYIKTCEEYI